MSDWRETVLEKVRGIDVPYSSRIVIVGQYSRILAGLCTDDGVTPTQWIYRQIAMHIAARTGEKFSTVLAELSPKDPMRGIDHTDCPHPGCDGAHLLD